ncbi:MAG: glycosyltransferase family 39 protein [candidate division WOR-3 bacterium]
MVPLYTPMIQFLKKNKLSIIFLFVLFLSGIIFIEKYPHSTFHLTSDSYEYANIAKNLVLKKNFFVNNIYALQLAFDFSRKIPVPSILRMPLYPLSISIFFKIFGISDKTILLTSFLFYIISGIFLLIFLDIFKLEDSIKILTLIFFMLNPIYLDLTFKGLSEPFAVSLFFLFLIFLFKGENLKDFLLSGFFLSLFILTRYYISLLFLFPVFFIFYRNKVSIKNIIIFLISVFLPLLPWLIRIYKITGNPFFNLGFYSLYGFEFANIPYKTSLNIRFSSFIENKIDSFFFYLKNLDKLTPFYLFPFAFLFKSSDENLKNLKTFLILSLLIFAPILGFINPEHRFLLYLSPLIILFSISFLNNFKSFFKFFVIFTLILIIHENKNIIKDCIKRNESFLLSEKVLKEIESLTPQDKFLISNADALIGFYTGRTCIFPLTYFEDYDYLFKLIPVDGIIIFQGVYRLFYMKYSFRDYEDYLKKEFPFTKKFPDGTVIYLRRY